MHSLFQLECDRTKQKFKTFYNDLKSCPGTSLLTGGCASGKDADCEGQFNTLYCQNGMYSQELTSALCKLTLCLYVFLYVISPNVSLQN